MKYLGENGIEDEGDHEDDGEDEDEDADEDEDSKEEPKSKRVHGVGHISNSENSAVGVGDFINGKASSAFEYEDEAEEEDN